MHYDRMDGPFSHSLYWLKKKLCDMGLFRRKNVQYTPIRRVKDAIKVENPDRIVAIITSYMFYVE